ncbi:MAG: hypothetical protein FWD34_10105 [Oscillospiraceae bacterium]|nr:hypothetical protein [Oscillospiraceae bacterium]
MYKASKIKITPKHILNGFLYIVSITVFYNITLLLLAFLKNYMNAEFQNVYFSALPLSFVSQLPLITYKLKNIEYISIIPCYILTVITLLILQGFCGDSFSNVFLSALPLTIASGLFLVSYKFWEWIKET